MQQETSLLGDRWDVLAVEYPDLELFTDAKLPLFFLIVLNAVKCILAH